MGKSADPLWLGLMADAYEAIGQTQMAWRIRRQAWIDLHHAWSPAGQQGAEVPHAGEEDDAASDPEDEENAQGAPARADLAADRGTGPDVRVGRCLAQSGHRNAAPRPRGSGRTPSVAG